MKTTSSTQVGIEPPADTTAAATRPIRSLAFHLAAAAGFAGMAIWLAMEGHGLAGIRRGLEWCCAVGSGALGLISADAAAKTWRAGPLVSLKVRARVADFVVVLAASTAVLVAGLRLGGSGRPAFVVFAVALALWLLAVGMHLVPALALGRHCLVAGLGRTLRFSELEWFEATDEKGGERMTLVAGTGEDVVLRARLTTHQGGKVVQALRKAGLRAGPRA